MSVSGTATSTTVGLEVLMTVLTASGKKLVIHFPSAGEGWEVEFSGQESTIPGNSSTEATTEIQGLRLIDFAEFISNSMSSLFSPLEVMEKLVMEKLDLEL